MYIHAKRQRKAHRRIAVQGSPEHRRRSVQVCIPGIIGVPDRLVLIPGGIVSFVELKAPGKKPRSIQRVVMRRLYHMGARVVTIDNVMTVVGFVDLIRRRPWNFIRTSIKKS